MNKIGFKNFRRFIDFKPIEYKDITFLVGRNNSGKSTMVKALLLISDYLKSGNLKEFHFGNSVLEDANIVTYSRALNNTALKRKEDFIWFTYQIDNYQIEISISGTPDKTCADVHQFIIKNQNENISIKIEPQISTITVSEDITSKEEKTSNSQLQNLENEIETLQFELNKSDLKKSSKEYLEKVDKLNLLRSRRNMLAHGYNVSETNTDNDEDTTIVKEPVEEYGKVDSFSVSYEYGKEKMLKEIYDSFQIDAINKYFESRSDSGEYEEPEKINYRSFYQERLKIEETIKEFIQKTQEQTFIYLGANPAKQSALFSIRDKNNALAQSIHDYYQLGIDKMPASEAFLFVKKWMGSEYFEIGEKIKIELCAGEAYQVEIELGGNKLPLADKGMGSIQAMLLILRLACIIHKSKINSMNPVVLIEEPELNLHPGLQSKLADLFLEVKQSGIKLIVETHSEYILRKTQVIVAVDELEVAPNENPFCVHYFPKDFMQQPYMLNYKADGSFDKNFGEGFFDEASASTLELLKIKRQKKS